MALHLDHRLQTFPTASAMLKSQQVTSRHTFTGIKAKELVSVSRNRKRKQHMHKLQVKPAHPPSNIPKTHKLQVKPAHPPSNIAMTKSRLCIQYSNDEMSIVL